MVYATVVGSRESPGSLEMAGLLEELQKLYPDLVGQVKKVVSELVRCTLLREDQLSSGLQDAVHKMSGATRTMRLEAARVRNPKP